jgi:hypothetical protein
LSHKKLILRRRSPSSSKLSCSTKNADTTREKTSAHRSIIFLLPAEKGKEECDIVKPINLAAADSAIDDTRTCEKSSGLKSQVFIDESVNNDDSIVSNQTFASSSIYSANDDSPFEKISVYADNFGSIRHLGLHENRSRASPTDRNYTSPRNNKSVSVKKDASFQTSLESFADSPTKISSYTQTNNQVHCVDDVREEAILSNEESLTPATLELLEGQKILWTSLSLVNKSPSLAPSVRRRTTVGEIVTSSPNNSRARPKPRVDLAISSPSSSHSPCSSSYQSISNASSSLSSFISVEDFEICDADTPVSYNSQKKATTLEKHDIKYKNSDKKRPSRNVQLEKAVMLRQKFSISSLSYEADGVR